MFRFLGIGILGALLVLGAPMANATVQHHFIHHPKLPPPKTTPPATGPGTSGEGQKWSCWMNPAAGLICIVIVGIVVDEVKRAIDGPACATGKLTRKSWFGMVVDAPMFWRPLCNWQEPSTVSVRY